ncbi:Na+/H+ antiporter NhaA [Microbacterium esteraromaticum]|uniref:Na(+)/H(+) antiporter NhaA n=1 Tax=Microbacterium esteraromaticum TaxID=57043 RepID=A0A939DWX2_9MICO|nr:Na+/H+ antiporter NhaA [Microbacterium esteraromaticum]MBN8205543.1 Na+/H+ antiporter NhaA [Microbacterium esteraromaticum]MBN8415697.1 Na+/H+ antiporter NhaA [Microbacterium esteraromaticum]MBN8423957.1 Na+/H+ antiporter NhaA [Microbacterium esteraromaticum]
MRISDNPLRGQQFPAALLLIAAGLGLLLANLPTHDAIGAVLDAHIAIPGTALDLSIAHWVSDGLLAVFFFVVAIELRYELTHGELDSPRKAVQPAIAATGGVLVPIAVYLLIAGAEPATAGGWPIPTATDIAFALGVLAMFGKGLPTSVRVFLLALAILDDIIGIVFIAVLFAHDVNWMQLGLAAVGVIGFGVLSRIVAKNGSSGIAVVMGVIAVATWGLVASSGIHATIAGVLLGLVMSPAPAEQVRHGLEPTVNGVILPLFAFVAAFVVIPQVAPSQLSPAFWGILVALPVGKIIGIGLFGWIAMRIRPKGTPPALELPDLLAAGALGGIGFTVSLLLANLAFAGDELVRDEAILGVLGGSLIALVLSGFIVSWRARHYRRATVAILD